MSSTNQQQEKMNFWIADDGNVKFITATLSWVEEQDFDQWGQLLNFVDNREPKPIEESQTRQQEIEEYDTDKMPTVDDIDEIYTLAQLDDRMRLTLDRVGNLIQRLEDEKEEEDDDEDSDDEYEKRIEALGPCPNKDGDKSYYVCDRIILGDCADPKWHREDKLRRNDEDMNLCPSCWEAGDNEDYEEVEVDCFCDKCFSEGTTFVSRTRANELHEQQIFENACPYGDKCVGDVRWDKPEWKVKYNDVVKMINFANKTMTEGGTEEMVWGEMTEEQVENVFEDVNHELHSEFGNKSSALLDFVKNYDY